MYASIFFKFVILPNNRDLIRFLISKGYALGIKVIGFTKHGNDRRKLSRRHTWKYNVKDYISWGSKAGLQYFSSNYLSLFTEVVRIKDFFYLSSAFYIEHWLRGSKQVIEEVLKNEDSTLSAVVMYPIIIVRVR